VATTEWFGEQKGALWPWATEQLESLDGETPEVLDATDGPNIEAIAAQKPDLITAMYTDLTEADYKKLSQIAPVITQSDGYVDYGIGWEEMTTQIGKAMGKSTEAEALVDEVNAQLDTVVEENPEFQGAQAVVATPYEGIFVYGPDDPRGRFLTRLGFELPEGLVKATGDEFGGNLSEENAGLLDGDLVIWLDPDDAEGDLGGPAYATFPVHTEGREVMLDSFGDPLGAATSFITPLSIPFLLDGLVPKMTAAMDGDPTTKVPE
jgi:iron complex transport system substrate-binding protein